MADRSAIPPPEPTGPPPARAAPRPGERATLAAAMILALSRAARAFTLYDPSNAVVRQFLAEFRAKAEAATAGGEVVLEIGPHELRCEAEIVYREEDREKSLAFRLYRDGVRRLVLHRGASFDDLLHLLQVLAIRFTGIRQAEDDVVTALRKAELRTVEIVAVEGYTTDAPDPEEDADDRFVRAAARARPLAPTFDQPLPRLVAPGPIAYRPVPEDALAPLWAAAGVEALEAGGLLVAAELVARGAQGAIPAEEVAQYCTELRDYLVAERHLSGLSSLADLVTRQPEGPLRERVMRGFSDHRMLDVLLEVVPSGRGALPPDALKLLPFVSAALLLDHLAKGDGGDRREAILGLVAARLPADAHLVIERLAATPAPVARALARDLASRAPERTADASLALLQHRDEGIRVDALRALGALPSGVDASRLVPHLDAAAEQVRIAAARALERHGGTGHARAVAVALASGRVASRDEATALGRALGILNPLAAVREVEGWLVEKRGLLRKLRGGEGPELLSWAAVAALGAIPSVDAERRLAAFAATVKDEELKAHCRATLAQRHGRKP